MSYCVLLALLVSMVTISFAANLINVALSKKTIQSSVYDWGSPARAVDGNTDQIWIHGSCSHTRPSNRPYWEVDLGTSYVITFIKVYNRRDCCSYRLSNVEVKFSTDHLTYARYGYHPGSIGSTYEFYPENPIVVARWVKISLLGVGRTLSLCEVEIMSNMAYRRDYLRAIHSVEGTGTSIASIPVVSKTQCVFLCNQEEDCHSVNVRHDMTSSMQMECQLLNHVSYNTTSDKNVTFWRMGTDL